ncbi:MAG: DNA methyltransferase [candidate division Zixibacteria bacterium]|nr:DNA methyltransferase [candidate division Zixibacteria bacterium]MDH3938787.1 DNA methyltransferase [candidate division Zixibacteria bacterium]MDH4032348.1 DNA methyltransferase [candidate division Zixibacteria bacterium]
MEERLNVNQRAPRNRTLYCTDEELRELSKSLIKVADDVCVEDVADTVINQDMVAAMPFLPHESVDLLVLDPPYNLSKNYNGHLFRRRESGDYQKWFASVIELIKPTLRRTATIYVCADWSTSLLVAPVLEEHMVIRNRITWEREKGRGAVHNWKNNTEDIWHCTNSEEYTFNVDNVKLKRRVIAPYRNQDGKPKDWTEEANGNFRLTYPSNVWTDITVPFWSMTENTDHPTQKPEKLIAKLILASSNPDDLVLDPFLGSGTTAVVSKKLRRRFVGIELNQEYCCWAVKRLNAAEANQSIQGYSDGVFWERNSLSDRSKKSESKDGQGEMFS